MAEDGEALVSAVLSGSGAPGVLVVDVVGRLALVAQRAGCAVRVSELCPELGELLDLAGLGVEVEGHAEVREQPLGVEQVKEEAHPGDLPR
jgi:hypothetical protein